MSSRSVRIPGQLAARVEALGEKERRRFAAMVALLVEEALDARARRFALPSDPPHPDTYTEADAQPRNVEARRLV